MRLPPTKPQGRKERCFSHCVPAGVDGDPGYRGTGLLGGCSYVRASSHDFWVSAGSTRARERRLRTERGERPRLTGANAAPGGPLFSRLCRSRVLEAAAGAEWAAGRRAGRAKKRGAGEPCGARGGGVAALGVSGLRGDRRRRRCGGLCWMDPGSARLRAGGAGAEAPVPGLQG